MYDVCFQCQCAKCKTFGASLNGSPAGLSFSRIPWDPPPGTGGGGGGLVSSPFFLLLCAEERDSLRCFPLEGGGGEERDLPFPHEMAKRSSFQVPKGAKEGRREVAFRNVPFSLCGGFPRGEGREGGREGRCQPCHVAIRGQGTLESFKDP